MTSADYEHPLTQGTGYGMIVGLGAFFSLGMMLITKLLRRYQKEIITSEEFATAGHSVKTSLMAAAIVSSWTWEATILNSTTMSYKTGIPGGYMYGAGACVQVIIFSLLAIRAKQIAPEAHTFLEIIKGRYGKWGHFCYMYYGLATNILVSAMLLAGVCATLNFLTGINKIASLFILPIGVIAYITYGGIKAVFITDYIHTIVIIVIILTFAFTVFATSDLIGSPGELWQQLTDLAIDHPSDNHEGSWLTFKSKSAGLFLLINICGNFATFMLDSSFYQKAIACDPKCVLPAYALGGLAWIAIPVLISTTMGLACRALENNPSFFLYPQGMTPSQISEGLALPLAATTLLGKGGAVASVLLVFMAFTSAMSAQVISVSSIITYDVYRTYINPKATGQKLMYVNYAGVVGFSLVMIGFSIGLIHSDVSLGFLYNFMGVIIASAVVPIAGTMFWKHQNIVAATVSPIIGSICAIIAWCVTAKAKYGAVTYDNLFEDYVMMAGNLVALCLPMFLTPLFTYLFKADNFDFESLKTKITRIDETEEIMEAEGEYSDEKQIEPMKSIATIGQRLGESAKQKMLAEEQSFLAKNLRVAAFLSIGIFLILIILVPMPLYGTGYIFSKKGFTAWVVIWIMWIFYTAAVVIIYPLYEGRHGIYQVLRGIYWDLSGNSYKLREWQDAHPEALHVVQSQISAAVHAEGRYDDKIAIIDDELSTKN